MWLSESSLRGLTEWCAGGSIPQSGPELLYKNHQHTVSRKLERVERSTSTQRAYQKTSLVLRDRFASKKGSHSKDEQNPLLYLDA